MCLFNINRSSGYTVEQNVARASQYLYSRTFSSFYRAACNADAVLWWEFCLSVRLSHACIVTKR